MFFDVKITRIKIISDWSWSQSRNVYFYLPQALAWTEKLVLRFFFRCSTRADSPVLALEKTGYTCLTK